MSPPTTHEASKDVKKESAMARLLGSGMYTVHLLQWFATMELNCDILTWNC